MAGEGIQVQCQNIIINIVGIVIRSVISKSASGCDIALANMTQSKDNPEKSRELISEDSMKDLLTKQLEIVGSGGAYVW